MTSNRIERFEKQLDSVIRSSEFTLSEISGSEMQSFSFENEILSDGREIYELSLKELREFARILTDVVINSVENPQTKDHYQYWALTAAFASSTPGILGGRSGASVGDYLDIVNMKISTLRLAQAINSIGFFKMKSEPLPRELIPFEQVLFFDPGLMGYTPFSERVATTTGFSVLEGLFSDQCSTLDAKTGRAVEDVEVLWFKDKSKISANSDTNLHEKFQIYRFFGASSEVAGVLDKINKLDRYDIDVLTGTFEGVKEKVENELEESGHFSMVLKKQRNENLHGQRTTRVIGAVVLNLCSLVVWDMIPPDVFDKHRGTVQEHINNWENSHANTGYSPERYLPLSRFRDPRIDW